MRWTIYLDLDAFYVSCERRDRPELEGRPVIVGPDPKTGARRGVVLSASYEARATGVHSAMPIVRADHLCPEATWIPPDFEKYVRASEEVRERLHRRFERVAALSIDEAAVGLEAEAPSEAERIARDVQRELASELRLPASLGVASTRTVAKIACDQAKPGGVRVVPPLETAQFLAPLPIRAIPGVGPKTEEHLGRVGITRIGELRSLPAPLRRELGRFGEELYRLARGELEEPEWTPEPGPRSRSTDLTFERDVADPLELAGAMGHLAEELGRSLGRERFRFRTVTVAVRWDDFTRTQRSRTLPGLQEGAEALRGASRTLLDELWEAEARGRGRRVRTLSLRVERLTAALDRQRRLDQFGTSGSPTVN